MRKTLTILIFISISIFIKGYYEDRFFKASKEESFLQASKNRNIKKLKKLLSLEIDVNIQDENGCTALMIASIGSHIQIVRKLIKAGAILNIQEDNYGYTALICASINGNTEIVKELIKVGADINIKDKNGNTALILLHIEVIQKWLEN